MEKQLLVNNNKGLVNCPGQRFLSLKPMLASSQLRERNVSTNCRIYVIVLSVKKRQLFHRLIFFTF